MASTDWTYPGSRWWKFDFHTHTPASRDTPWYREKLALSPQDWLLKFMAAEVDCVAITDHNSGTWIDPLKSAYAELKQQTEQAQPPTRFRELTLFPGVEISAHGGVHILALFDPSATTSNIDTLLGRLDYRGTKGDSDGVTMTGIAETFRIILEMGAIPIPAHADDYTKKGLLACQPGSQKSQVDANTLRQAFAFEGLLAIEWLDSNAPWPQCVAQEASRLARVLGSDCHSFQGIDIPGSRFTWVKMAHPTLEGLRLALLDGNSISLRRSDEGVFDPFRVPAHLIRSIAVEEAYCLGRGRPAKLDFSPFFNAIIGGRGTGKSTVVHALRLAMRRDAELTLLGPESESRKRFEQFCKSAPGRANPSQDQGALREDTKICVEWQHEGMRLKLIWRADGQGTVVQEWHGHEWLDSTSQSINAARFPIRVFSQGQIAAMADTGRQSVLAIIDEAANIEPLQQQYADAQRTFFAQRAKLRELQGKLAGKPEVERKLQEIERKLAAFSQTDHATVLRSFAQAQHQQREVEGLLQQLDGGATAIETLAEQIMLDDWPEHFGSQDADLLAWRQAVDQSVEQARAHLHQQATDLRTTITALKADGRLAAWRIRAQAAEQAHQQLQQRMVEQGFTDPQAFARLTQERQNLDTQCKALEQMQSDYSALLQQLDTQHQLITQRRQAITSARQRFIERTLANNAHVRITVADFGFEDRQYERELRQLIDANDERFAEDILSIENGKPIKGIAYDLAQASATNRMAAIETVKTKLLTTADSLGGHFRNYLKRKHEKPEFADHILTWFPEDDLRIEYQRDNQWISIKQGSQGQRSAALLAFLLAFGEEPIVLDQPEDDLDNHLIYDLIVRQIRENKQRRQLVIITHNPNVVVNGDAELVCVMNFGRGQCYVQNSGALQEQAVREEVCQVMEGGREAFARRWKRLGREV